MRKILRIETCYDCPYWQEPQPGDCYCGKQGRAVPCGRKEIPESCPLEDDFIKPNDGLKWEYFHYHPEREWELYADRMNKSIDELEEWEKRGIVKNAIIQEIRDFL